MRVCCCFIIAISFFSCQNKSDKHLEVVTYEQFEAFVNATNYITDAEKYGWSIVQQDVYNYTTAKNANWKLPDGKNPPASKQLPVTQVSYNDAIAYCKWANTKLPTYNEYWDMVSDDKREIVSDNKAPISDANKVNIVGNVWDITATQDTKNVRLAGGSLFCSPDTCHGTSKDREMFVDKETGNINIGFAVLTN